MMTTLRAACLSTAATLALIPAISAAAQPKSAEAARRARLDALISQMTPAEKAAQLVIYFAIGNPQATEQNVANGAGALLFVTDPQEANRLQRIAVEKTRLKIPLLFGYDVIHGLSTIFPVPIGLAASWDPAMVTASQAVAATEARSIGITWTFSPMIDIARDPRWGRMVEGPGEDPFLASAMAAAQVRGLQGPAIGTPGRILSGAKHFAGYGAAVGGRDFDEANISDEQLRNVYFPPFKAAIDAGTGTVMSAYMALNGMPAAGNQWLLTDVLRKEWGFSGWVVSDNGSVGALRTHGLTVDDQDSAVRALQAGLGMEMAMQRPAFGELPDALAKKKITKAQLDSAVRHILEAKMKLGLFDQPFVDETLAAKTLLSPANLDQARLAAERSAVLLKNDGGLLPLDRSKLQSLAIIGPLADSPRDAVGAWVFNQTNPAQQSILAGIREKLGAAVKLTYTPGVATGRRMTPNPMAASQGVIARPAPADETAGIAEAVAAAKAADVAVVVVGETFDMTGELASESSLDLPGRQQELLDAVVAAGKPVVVLVMNGRPLNLKGTKAAAILDIWYPGSRGGTATANLLFGDAVPGGKLPFTWPRNAGQIPLYYSRMTTHAPGGLNSRYFNEPGAPVYPFGHGLSYSTFTYANFRIDKPKISPSESVTVAVDLTNSGMRTADEVAQLYIHQRSGTAARPVRELKGFQRVTLKPGETRTLQFVVGPDARRYWNSATRNWTLDQSVFDVGVGGDSTVKFGGTFTVAVP